MFCTKHLMTDLLAAVREYIFHYRLLIRISTISLPQEKNMHLVITSFCFARSKNSVRNIQCSHTISMLKDTTNYVLSVFQSREKTGNLSFFFNKQKIGFWRVLYMGILLILHDPRSILYFWWFSKCFNPSVWNQDGYSSLVVNRRLEAAIEIAPVSQNATLSWRDLVSGTWLPPCTGMHDSCLVS